MSDREIYDRTMTALYTYYDAEQVLEKFLNGGCYWLAQFLHGKMNNSYVMFNKQKEHCAVEFGNHLYDVTGRISPKNYVIASDREIHYMRKYYIPEFDTDRVRQYLNQNLEHKLS